MKKNQIPPMLADIVKAGLDICENVLFDQGGSCPDCGGTSSGYDEKKKQFAVVTEDELKRTIEVRVKRFSCHTCGAVFFAEQPFYPGTRIGSPVVDLCTAFSETIPYSRASSLLGEMGIFVDRWSVRNYVHCGYRHTSSVNMFGVRLPSSILALSGLAAGVSNNKRIESSEIIEACASPSRRKSSPNPEKNRESG